MCVILYLKAGYTLPYDLLFNAAHNNPDGWGLIVKRDGQLTVTKDLPEGGNDPKIIYKMLKDHEDADRFLHVRHKTAGSISIENTQPFKVYDNSGREIWFMHNGTLSQYTPPYQHFNHQQNNNVESQISDSRKFAEVVLARYLPKFMGSNGLADYQDPVIQEFIMSKWNGSHNRGLLVCNDMEPMFINAEAWEIIKTKETITVDGKEQEVEGSFLASNNDYFERLKRGPLFDKLEEARKKKEEEERQAKNKDKKVEVSLGELDSSELLKKYLLSEEIVNCLEDYDIYSREGYAQLANLTYYEWLSFVVKQEDEDISCMLMYLTDFLKKAVDEIEDLQKKLKKFEAVEELDAVA